MTIKQWYRTPTVSNLRLSKEWVGEPTGAPPRWVRPGINRTAFDFLRVFDRSILEGLEKLLLKPDPPYLVGRGKLLRYEGALDRFRKWLPIRVRAIRAREFAQFGMEDDAEQDTKA